MPQAIPTDELTAALLARGALAQQGRYTPFASATANPPIAAVDPSAASALALRNAAPVGTGASGAAVGPVPATSGAPDKLPVNDKTLDKLSESDITGLLAALGIAGGAALTGYLLRRRRRLNQPTDDIPLVEGTIEPNTTKRGIVGDNIIDGEYTNVDSAVKAVANTKRIAQGAHTPNNQGMKALGAPTEVDVPKLQNTGTQTRTPRQSSPGNPVSKRTAASAIAARTRAEPNDIGTIPLNDSMSDLTPAERAQATSLVEQLKRERLRGNAANRRRLTGDRILRSTLPTGTVNDRSLLGIVVRAIRTAKLKPQVIGRLP